MNKTELLRKADLALGDLINSGGYMQPEQQKTFFRKLIDQPTILKDIRTIQMARPQMEINKIGFGSRVLQAAKNSGTQNGGPFGITAGIGGGARSPTRTMPDLSRITMTTSELIAEVDLPYEVIEDNIEGGQIDGSQFEQTVLDMLAARASLDLEEWLINADTASGDSFLALQNGIIKLSTSNIVNQGNNPVDPQLFADMIKVLPKKYHRMLNQYVFYVPTLKEIDYRMQVAQRQTSLGDAILTGTSPVSVLGVPMKSATQMPNDKIILSIPKNFLMGIQRNFRLEFQRDVRERVIVMVLTMRAALQVEEEDMVAKAISVG